MPPKAKGKAAPPSPKGGSKAGAASKSKSPPPSPKGKAKAGAKPKGKAKAKSKAGASGPGSRQVSGGGLSADTQENADARSKFERYQEEYLRFKGQYEPDSSLLMLSTFPKGTVYVDPHHVSLVEQANALVMQDLEDVNQIGYKYMTPLWMAARTGNIDMANYLLERGAKPSMADADGYTPLHIAVLKKQRLAVLHLLTNKVTGDPTMISARTNAGLTPLHLAVLSAQRDTLKLLIELKADPLERNPIMSEDTALHMAVRENRHPPESEQVIEDLMFHLYKRSLKLEEEGETEEAIKVMNPQNSHGDTPLHAAGFEQAVMILLGYHAKGNIRNKDGKFPFEVCRAGSSARAMLNSLMRKAPLPRRTDLRFDIPTVDNALRFEHKTDVFKKFTLI